MATITDKLQLSKIGCIKITLNHFNSDFRTTYILLHNEERVYCIYSQLYILISKYNISTSSNTEI
jgi:hypothetical protein